MDNRRPHHSHFIPPHQHQQARYAPPPSHHPRHPQFPEEASFHSHNPPPHLLPPQPPAATPPQPPLPPVSHRVNYTPPPPQPYNPPPPPPHQSSFPFNTPNYVHQGHHRFEEGRSISANRHHEFSHSQRFSNRVLLDSNIPRHNLPAFDHRNAENRIGAWNPPRVLADNRPSRAYPQPDFDLELHQRPSDHHQPMSPYQPIDKLRYESEGNSRLRMEHIDGYESNTRDELARGRGDGNYHRRGDFASSHDANSGEYGNLTSQSTLSRDIDSRSGSFVSRYGLECDNELARGSRRDGHGESKRWVNDRIALRDVHDSTFEFGNSKMGACEGDWILSGKREYYGSEQGRYNNRGNRDGSHEYNRTPKKQTQKKSALLRIQTTRPNHRNREAEQLHYTNYVNDSNTNSFRGKDQHGYSGYGARAEERETSPVELDISFKSNSLVAKAILAPSSSAIVSDTDVTSASDTAFASAENKKVFVSDNDCSDLQPGKLSIGVVNLSSSPSIADDTFSSGKDLRFEKNAFDRCSKPCSSVICSPNGKNEAVQSSKGIISVGITQTPSVKTSPRVVKKKKIVKKLVKKVDRNSSLHMSTSLSEKKHDGTMQADTITVSPSVVSGTDKIETSLKFTAADKSTMPDCLHPSSNEGNRLPENRKDVAPLSVGLNSRSQDCSANKKSDVGSVARTGSREISCSPSPALFKKDKKSDTDLLDADNSICGLQILPNADKVTKSLDGCTSSDISNMDGGEKQFYQNEVSLSPGKYSNVGDSENRLHLGDNMSGRLSSAGDTVDSTDLINKCVAGLSSNNIACKSQEIINISSAGFVDEPCSEDKVPAVTESSILEENLISVPSCSIVDLLTSGNAMIKKSECLQHAEECEQGSNNGSANSGDKTTVSSSSVLNGAGKQVSPNDVTLSLENCSKEVFPNSEISVRFGDGEANIKKRKARTHLDFSSLEEAISPDPVNSVILANVVDTSSNPTYQVPSPFEVSGTAAQSLDFNLRSNIDGVAVLHGENGVLEAEVSVGNNGNSPMCKRKTFTATYPNLASGQSEFSYRTVVPISCAENASIDDNQGQAHQKEVATPSMPSLSATYMTSSEDRTNLPGIMLDRDVFETVVANRETVSSNPCELQHGIASDLVIPNVQSPFPIMEGVQKENDTHIVSTHNSQMDIVVIENIKGESMDIQAAEEKITSSIESPVCIDSSEHQFRDFVQISTTADMESNVHTVKGDLPTEENYLSCPTDCDGGTTSNSNDESTEAVPDALLDLCSPGITSEAPDIEISDCQPVNNDNIGGHEENLDSKSMIQHDSDMPAWTLSAPHIINDIKSDHVTECNNSIVGKITSQPSEVNSRIATQGLKLSCSQLNEGKHQPSHVNNPNFQGHSSSVLFTSSTLKSTHISKARTWHRTGNSSTASLPGKKPSAGAFPYKRPIPGRKGNFQNAGYIRKGNSLLRKLPPVAAFPQGSSINQSPSLGLDEFQRGMRSEGRVDITDQTNVIKTAVTNDPLERQRSLPLSAVSKLSNSGAPSLENTSSPLRVAPFYGCCESTSDARKMIETNDSPNSIEDMLQCSRSPENQTGPSNNEECQIEAIDGNLSSLNTKKIVYVKRKSNQLVATSNSCDISVASDDKGQTAPSDSYYKRNKNQLVRTTLESHINQTVSLPKGTANSDHKASCKVVCNRRLSKRRSLKVSGMSRKPWRASLVWTLCGTSSSKDDSDLLHHQKILPPLFPWKRATYLRSFICNAASSFNSNSLSAISKKLLLLRKRDTVYVRSTHGLSLRKSKVLGVGGSSLKWSKSIEKHSKKANEEATRAVAAAERKKREQNDAACVGSRAKRERIFRIGSVRYRMDPSRQTLQSISDDKSMPSTSIQPGSDAKRSYIPRRLVIGNDEYVRIGNGNQLIRDPKKRTRILANEKVRWSLHTARQRLARKQKYCQFFTRFGKCNKDDGKCPYIHDPSKIAVCTKFLNGLCSIPDCKLTHKIIPERMPDCSYFLQGSCTNRNCPYRHVNVNPKASICEGFLKGYCANGNECRKKHSYVCPTFEATGTCTQGTKCKLHHPKSKGKKRKRSGDQKNSRGRYFGSVTWDVSEPGTAVAPMQCQQHSDGMEGDFADYISLDFSDEEVLERVGQSSKQATLCDRDEEVLDNLDELIKPVLIMKKKFSEQSSLGLQATV